MPEKHSYLHLLAVSYCRHHRYTYSSRFGHFRILHPYYKHILFSFKDGFVLAFDTTRPELTYEFFCNNFEQAMIQVVRYKLAKIS